MLHLQSSRPTHTADWSVQGWPALLADHPAAAVLFWALNELPAAADVGDWDVVDDLLDECSAWLDRIGTAAGGAGPVLVSVWAEVQRGRGAEDAEHLGYHSRLLQRLVTPASPGPRPSLAVPAYVAPELRVTGGRLPLHAPDFPPSAGRAPLEEFLLEVITVLSNRRGHLSDHIAHRCPPGVPAQRAGWTRSGRAGGPLLGSLDPSTDRILLIPEPSVAVAAPELTVSTLGAALAAAWLVDTTLDPAAGERRPTVDAAVIAGAAAQPVWQIPLRLFDPAQFFPASLRPRLVRD